MKRVLVTGGAGFIGSHLSEALLARGDHVTVIDDESTGTATNLSQILDHRRFRFVPGTVADQGLTREVLADADEVYHLAAAVGVALIASQPMETIQRNIYPTDFILTALRQRVQKGDPVKCFLASSSEVYGKNPKPIWNEEDDLVLGPTTRPRWSYGASKAIDEFLGLASWREYKVPVVIGRFFNVVGPRQTGAHGMVLPRFVDAALGGKPLVVHDDGQQIRCFAHVNDIIEAVIALMRTDDAVGHVINIGSDQPVSILELAERVIKACGSTSKIEFRSYAAAYDESFEDIRRRVPDLTKLRGTIDYRPEFDLDGIITGVLEARRAGS